MKRGLLCILFIACFLGSRGQKQVIVDSASIIPRNFNAKKLAEYRNDTDFQYNRYVEPAPSLWERFWKWFWWKVNDIMSTKSGRVTVWTLIGLASVAIILFFIYKMTGADRGGLFGRKSTGYALNPTSENDIYNISFEDAIAKAVKEENYRLAIRLHYLQALKTLSDNGLIGWKLNKTNSDYLHEMQASPAYDIFRRLTYHFEYTWYGEKNLDMARYTEMSLQFQQFNTQLQ